VKPSKRVGEVRIRNVQRYGARLRRQLDAINLAREQVKALTTAAKAAGDSADSLAAITVQLIQQQVLSILLQTAQPGSSDQTETADGEPKTLDLRDLQRLTRIIVDLNRVTNGNHQRAGKAAHIGKATADVSAEPQQKGLSEKAYHMIRNALLTRYPVEAYSDDWPPDEPDTTPAEPVATPAAPAEAPAEPAALAERSQPIADNAAPPEAPQSSSGSSETTQPELTAAPRIYPHNHVYHLPLDNITNWTWATIVHPKRVSFPLRLSTPAPPDAQSTARDEKARSSDSREPGRTNGKSLEGVSRNQTSPNHQAFSFRHSAVHRG
jgi:Protein of unknown function (DUF3486)